MEEELVQKNTLQKKPWKQKHVDLSLGLISFAESSFLPIIADPFLVAMTLARPKCWWRYILITAFASILGGLFGYLLGAIFFDLIGAKLIAIYNLEETFHKTVEAVDKNAFVFTLLGAFTPIPYKLVAIVAGFLKINIFLFILASLMGRFLRFALVGYITKRFGGQALRLFNHRFGFVSAFVIGVSCLYLVIVFLK